MGKEKVLDKLTANPDSAEEVRDVALSDRMDVGKDAADIFCSPNKNCPTPAERKKMIEDNIKKLPEISDMLDGIDQLDLAKLSVDTLIKLEDRYPGILLYVFTDIIDEAEKMDFDK